MKEIIAECGPSWHNIEEAKELINRSKQVNADACKFQFYDIDEILKGPHKTKKWYMDTLKKFDKMLRKVQLTESTAKELVKHARNKKMEIFFTPMYVDAVDICESLAVKRYKVRHLDAYWNDLLLKIRMTEKPCYVSRNTFDSLDPIKQRNFYTVYIDKKRPTKYNEVFKGYSNLIRSDGYSCHCEKLYAVLQCMVFGGVDYIEVHVTLDSKDTSLPDWRYSFPFVDVLEMCSFRDLLNSRARENPSKWEIA